MALNSNCERKTNRWVATTSWFAGIGVFLVELSASVNYLQAAFEKHGPSLFGLMPAAAMFTVRFVAGLAHNYGTLEYAMRSLPLAAVPLALMATGLIFERRSTE